MERELLLLGLLRSHKMHGYQLHEFINDTLASCTDMKKPTAYHLLNRMAEDGWIITTDDDSEDTNRPPRRVYQITSEGETVFQRLLRENLALHHPATFADNIGLAFLDSLEPSEALNLLHQRRAALTHDLEQFNAVPHHHGSMQLVIDHQVHHLKSELVWLDEVIQRLQSRS